MGKQGYRRVLLAISGIILLVLIYPYFVRAELILNISSPTCQNYQIYYWTRDKIFGNKYNPIRLYASSNNEANLHFKIPMAVSILRIDLCDGEHDYQIKHLTLKVGSKTTLILPKQLSNWEPFQIINFKNQKDYLNFQTIGIDPQIVNRNFEVNINNVASFPYTYIWTNFRNLNQYIFPLFLLLLFFGLNQNYVFWAEIAILTGASYIYMEKSYGQFQSLFSPALIPNNEALGMIHYLGYSNISDTLTVAILIILPTFIYLTLNIRQKIIFLLLGRTKLQILNRFLSIISILIAIIIYTASTSP